MTTSKFIFCGVQPGYHNISKFTPETATKIVSDLLSAKKINIPVYSALAVYPYDRGCPVGGEPVAAFQLSGSCEKILNTAEYLRNSLNQVTLNVPLPKHGQTSMGFTASVIGNLFEVGCAWQKIAKQYQLSSNIHVSTGIVDFGNGQLLLSADANPKNIPDLSLWKNIAMDIFQELKISSPSFHHIGYNFVPPLP